MTSRAQSVTTLVLVSVAASLGAYMLFIDRGKPTSAELETRKNNLLHVFRRAEISEVQLEVGGEKARFVREVASDGALSDFQLFLSSAQGEAPKGEPADPSALDRLLQTIEFASPLRKVDSASTPASMGLDRPRAVLLLRMGAISSRIELGKEATTPTGASYASVPGEGSFVVARDFAADLLKPIESYRSRTILPYVASDTSAIRLDGIGGTRNLIRAPWGGFRVETPGGQGPRLHRGVFDQILNALAAMRAERFIPAAAADDVLRGAKKDGTFVSLVMEPTDKSRPTARVEIGGDCPAAAGRDDAGLDGGLVESSKLIVVVRRDPQPIYACMSASVMEGLRASQELLADKHLLDLRPDDIEELKVQRAERTLELVRKGAGWKLRQPEERDVTNLDAKGLIEGLTRLEGEIIPGADLKALGLDPPKGSLVVIQPASGRQEHPQQKLDLGDDQGEFVWVRRTQDGVVLRIPRNQAHLVEPVSTYLRSSELLAVAPEKVRKVSLSWGKDEKQSLVRTPSGFKLDVPPGYSADGSMSADLFDTVAKLTAERWVAARDDGSYGFSQPRATALFEIAAEGGIKSWRLLVGARIGDGTYARWEPDTGVFVLPRSAETTLSSYVIDRSYFMLDPSEVRSMALSTGAKRFVITVQAGGKWAADPVASLPESSVDRIQAAFLEMRAEGAMHLGDPLESEGLSKPLLEIVVRRVPGHDERSKDIRITIGRSDVWRTLNVYYARREGIAATYVIAASRLKPVLTAVGIE